MPTAHTFINSILCALDKVSINPHNLAMGDVVWHQFEFP